MADLAAANVTHTKRYVSSNNDGTKKWIGQVSFGDGALTYPTGGIPSAIGKYGFARQLLTWSVIETNGNGIIYEYDVSASTIRALFPTDETGVNAARKAVEFVGATTAPAATVLQIEATGY